ncbi:MAG: hypothetical protein Q4A54_04605, partial [Parabacteroides sp.]|nr:hypothetical protein [Parabacteroides sp.]
MREFVSLVYEEDTLSHYNEYMVDYLLPRDKKTKFSGVYRPRVLNKRSYERVSNAKKDSVVAEDEELDLSLIEILDLKKEAIEAPASFKKITGRIKTDSVVAKYGVEKVYRLTPNSFTIFEDELANKKNHKWTPFIFKLFGFTIDFFEMREATAFIPNEEGVYKYEDMISNTVGYDMNVRGKTFKKMVKSNKPLRAKTLFEQYVTSREYLTVEEAEAIQNETPKNEPIVVPSCASPLDPATQRLVEQTEALKKKQ